MNWSRETGVASGRQIMMLAVVVLAVVAASMMWTSKSWLSRACRKRAVADIATLVEALDDFAAAHEKRYPADLQELFGKDARDNPYLVKFRGRIPRDGWGHAFVYEPPTEAHPRPRVLSYGGDGERGGSGDDADVDSDKPAPVR
jgi:general secretion pathway protein G